MNESTFQATSRLMRRGMMIKVLVAERSKEMQRESAKLIKTIDQIIPSWVSLDLKPRADEVTHDLKRLLHAMRRDVSRVQVTNPSWQGKWHATMTELLTKMKQLARQPRPPKQLMLFEC